MPRKISTLQSSSVALQVLWATDLATLEAILEAAMLSKTTQQDLKQDRGALSSQLEPLHDSSEENNIAACSFAVADQKLDVHKLL